MVADLVLWTDNAMQVCNSELVYLYCLFSGVVACTLMQVYNSECVYALPVLRAGMLKVLSYFLFSVKK